MENNIMRFKRLNTRNFSILRNVVNQYYRTKLFAEKKKSSNAGKYIAGGLVGAAAAGVPLGYLLNESNKDRDTAKGERDTAVKDKETAVAAQKAAEQERDTAVEAHDKLKQESADLINQNDELNAALAAQRILNDQVSKDAGFYKQKYNDLWYKYKHDHYITSDPRVHRFDTQREAAYYISKNPQGEFEQHHIPGDDHPYMVVDRTYWGD